MKNKIVLITGATSGIGKATAIKFAKAGAKVVLSGRRETEGQKVVSLIKNDGGEATFIQADITQEEDVAALVQGVIDTYGKLDIAFNNAGVETTGPILDVTHADYLKTFDTNVWGVLTSMKYEIPRLQENGGGVIINTSSIAGHIGMAGASVYIASKHAVEGFTKSAALEYADQNIRINAVSPAVIETDMVDRFAGPKGTEARDALEAQHPIGRAGKPDEIADAVLFLASDQASFITGESLKIDGGWTA